jgi:TolB-like protein/Flp pilus assembly protein TadD
MFTDIVGYTSLMARDEEAARRARDRHAALIRPLVEQHHGQWIEATGDESLSAFPSSLDAVRCALVIQDSLRDDAELQLRIGIHQGDVTFESDRVSGDGVNLAARVRPLAEPGGICVSDEVQHSLRGRTDLEFASLGEQHLKNVGRPFAVHAVGRPGTISLPRRAPVGPSRWMRRHLVVGALFLATILAIGSWLWDRLAPTADSVRPTIAVLAFSNLSGDAEQEFFSDGLTVDIITALSRFPELFVVSQDADFAFKNRAVEVREVGRELGVRYVLKGSVRREDNQVRVAARLIEAETGEHLWAESYDDDLTVRNLYAVQEDIAQRVVSTVADPSGVIARLGQSKARGRATESLDAYTCVLRAYAYYDLHDESAHLRARDCLERAVEIDPDYGDAWAHLSYLYYEEFHHGFNTRPNALDRALEAGRRAVALDPANPRAHFGLAMTHYGRREIGLQRASTERALALNPNDSIIGAGLGLNLAYSGDWEKGIAIARRAASLNPLHPGWLHLGLAAHGYQQGEYEEALTELAKARRPETDEQVLVHLAACSGQLGRATEARTALEALVEMHPSYAEDPRAELRRLYASDAMIDRLLEGLRKAGLKEE